ncbi:MAG: hypothetical protein ACR2F8_03050 [Caulobacteraceae bacterium]
MRRALRILAVAALAALVTGGGFWALEPGRPWWVTAYAFTVVTGVIFALLFDLRRWWRGGR